MSGLLGNCFEDQGAAFYRDVHHEGVLIARIRPLRPLDRDALQGYLGRWIMKDGTPVYDTSGIRPETLRLARIVIALGGILDGRSFRVGEEGWLFTDNEGRTPEVTLDTVNRLSPVYLEALDHAVSAFENEYQVRREGLRKN
jgi:hypothetical protein